VPTPDWEMATSDPATEMLAWLAAPLFGALDIQTTAAEKAGVRSQVFRVNGCPVHDEQLRHVGMDALLHLLSANGSKCTERIVP